MTGRTTFRRTTVNVVIVIASHSPQSPESASSGLGVYPDEAVCTCQPVPSKGKHDGRQNHGDDSDHYRQRHTELDVVHECVPARTKDHQVRLVTHWRDETAGGPDHQGHGKGHEAHPEAAGQDQCDGVHEGRRSDVGDEGVHDDAADEEVEELSEKLQNLKINFKNLEIIEECIFYPPEFLHKQLYSPKTDIYYFGILIYLLLLTFTLFFL